MIYQSSVPDRFVDRLWERRAKGWRPLDLRTAAHDYEPGLPVVVFDRAAVNVTTPQGLDLALLDVLWGHFHAANEHWKFPVGAIEVDGINRYRVGGSAPTHTDTGQGAGTDDRLLAMTLVLSDNHEGGELVIYPPGDREWVLQPARGGVVVFPAHWRHRVNPVTHGCRFSFVARATRHAPGVERRYSRDGQIGFLTPSRGEWGRLYQAQKTRNREASR